MVTEKPPTRTGLVVATVLLAIGPSSAGEGNPWDERVILEQIDSRKFQGRITGDKFQSLRDAGERLFVGKFVTADGAGRPMATQAIIPTKRRNEVRTSFQRLPGPDANSCSSCHNDPVPGGAGHLTANVFVSEGFTNPDFDTSDPQFSNERNTNHLMGAGLVELLAREMTRDLVAQRRNVLETARSIGKPATIELMTKGISFGRITAYPDGIIDLDQIEGVDDDLNIRPFSQKGVFTSLRQFTVNAMNHHHGMQAVERFGLRWTGEADFDADGVASELGEGDISALVAWQASLRPPVQKVPENDRWRAAAASGEKLFEDIGCASCHIPTLPLESAIFADPAPFDVAGTLRKGEGISDISYDLSAFDWAKDLKRNAEGHLMVPLFSDLKRHRISDQKTAVFGNELLAQRFVERDQFQTTELWGVASTGPYGHRGDLTTLDEAIRAHGGEAAQSAGAYTELSAQERDSIIAFLKTLVIEP